MILAGLSLIFRDMSNVNQKLLTPLELKVMNVLWNLKKAFVKEILGSWPEPVKPAYNTISTTVRILQDKAFVDHESVGRGHMYFPAVTKAEYQKMHIKNVLENVFAGSASNLVSALVENKNVSQSDIDVIKDMIDKA